MVIAVESERTFAARSFGCVPDSGHDAGPGLRAALAEAGRWAAEGTGRSATVLVEPGTHRIDPRGDEPYALSITGQSSITVSGAGALLLFTDPHVGAVSLQDTVDVSLHGCTIDYETPSFTQGRIIDVDQERGTFWFVPERGYPTFDDERLYTGTGYGTLRDGRSGRVKSDSRITFMISHERSPRSDGAWLVRVEDANREWFGDVEVGDGFVTGHRGEIHGIRLSRTARTKLTDLRILSAPCAAIISDGSEDTELRRVTVAVDPGSGRWISSNADAFHCQGGRRGPKIVDCDFSGMHDDGVNIYAAGRPVLASDSTTVTVRPGAPILPGDRVQVFDPTTGSVRGETRVESVRSTGDGDLMLVLAEPVDGVSAGDDLFNRDDSGEGFSIVGTRFHDFRGIGIRLKASNGTVFGNRFSDLAGPAMWIANDPGWHEGPVGSRDVTIADNTVCRAPLDRSLWSWPECAAAIVIATFSERNDLADSRSHRDLVLRGNRVESAARHAVYVGNASRVDIDDLKLLVHVDASTGAEAFFRADALGLADSSTVRATRVSVGVTPALRA